MPQLYNLLDNDGDVVGLINAEGHPETIQKLWEDYYKSDERHEADDVGEVIDVFLAKLQEQNIQAEQTFINEIFA